MLSTEFTFNLSEPIKAGKVTIGFFDGVHPSIVAVTRSDKIFVHNPHNRSVYDPDNSLSSSRDGDSAVGQFTTASSGNDLDFLNINQTITCLAAGPISSNETSSALSEVKISSAGSKASGSGTVGAGVGPVRRKSIRQKNQINNDVLVVGTKTSIHVYDILHNSDLYYKEIPDGANAVAIGEFGKVSDGNLAMIGGNCAIHGFDRDGNDAYWTVTGDNISAMALVDIDNDGQNELVVGSEDCEIQVFKKDAIIIELVETDKVTCLCSLGPMLFAYALANGTVGVYQTNGERLWRIKSKNQPVCLLGADVNNDGQVELLTGWSNGKLDIRVAHSGEVMYRENFKSSIAGVMIADYNMDGKNELLVCTVNGEVYGYRLETHEEHQQVISSSFEQDSIRELMKRKQTLMHELHNYEENYRIQNIVDPPVVTNRGKVLNETGEVYGAIPASTKIKSSLLLKQGDDNCMGLIELKLETTNDTEIRAAIVFAEGIFKNESIVIYPHDDLVSNKICVELRPPKDIAIDLHVKALVGYRASTHFHVFELSRHLPRFAMYGFFRSESLSAEQTTNGTPAGQPAASRGGDLFNGGRVTSQLSGEFTEPPASVADRLNLKQERTRNQAWDQIYTSLNNPEASNENVPVEVHQPQSYVTFRITDTLGKVVEWINANFLLDQEIETNEEERKLEFVSLRNQKGLVIELRRGGDLGVYRQSPEKALQSATSKFGSVKGASQEHQPSVDTEEAMLESDFLGITGGKGNERRTLKRDSAFEGQSSSNSVTIYCDSMDMAGLCIQSLAGEYLAIANLPCAKAHFPEDIARLKGFIDRVEEIQSVRQHLVAEVADSANLIRSAVVQAEDARLIEEYTRMKQIYNDLSMLNREILREHTIRCQNHQDLVDSLKQINVIIQRASNLRIGTYKTSLVNACRDAIKQKNFAQLFKIISED